MCVGVCICIKKMVCARLCVCAEREREKECVRMYPRVCECVQ